MRNGDKEKVKCKRSMHGYYVCWDVRAKTKTNANAESRIGKV